MSTARKQLMERMALVGAVRYLEQIQGELEEIYTAFPHLFPNGVPMIAKIERPAVPARSRASKAKRLIEGANRLRRLHGRGNGRRTKYTYAMPPPDKGMITFKEAAALCECSEAGVRLWAKEGKLRIAGKDDQGRLTVRRSDVIAFQQAREQSKQAREQSKTIKEEQRELARAAS